MRNTSTAVPVGRFSPGDGTWLTIGRLGFGRGFCLPSLRPASARRWSAFATLRPLRSGTFTSVPARMTLTAVPRLRRRPGTGTWLAMVPFAIELRSDVPEREVRCDEALVGLART